MNLFTLCTYDKRPINSIRLASQLVRDNGFWPDYLMLSPRALDHLSRDLDPPGRALITQADGLNVIVDSDFIGCTLLAYHVLSGDPLEVMVTWDTDQFYEHTCEDDCDCE